MTLRSRIMAGYLVVVVVLVAAAGVLLTAQHGRAALALDRRLGAAAVRISALPASDVEALTASDRVGRRAVRLQRLLAGMYVGIVSGGHLQTLQEAGGDASAAPTWPLAGTAGSPLTVATSGGGLRVEVTSTADSVPVVLGLPTSATSPASSPVLLDVVLLLGALVLVAGAAIIWTLRLGVDPIRRVTDVAREVGAGNRDVRVEEFPAGTEAAELGSAFNSLLVSQAAGEQRLRQFVADASHELRTPLATLTGYSQLYAAGGLTDEAAVADAMSRIRQEAGRMQGIVDDLLLLADLDRGPTLTFTDVDLVPVVEGLASDLRVLDPSRSVTVDAPVPVVVRADVRRLTQAIAVITSNALKHTDAGTPVEITAAREGTSAVVVVRDHGRGIDPDDVPRIFDRFYRAPSAAGRKGSGLGLAIAAALVDAHGGTVRADNASGGGARFTLTLPLVR
jgi:two-component system, OmpR family, sensor kinase